MGDIHGYPSFLLFHGENHDQLSIQGATPVPEVLGCWWWQCGSPGGHVDSWTVLGFFVFFCPSRKQVVVSQTWIWNLEMQARASRRVESLNRVKVAISFLSTRSCHMGMGQYS